MEKMTIRAEVMTMALKDIFTMVKADRYTADGCEVLNKAREADVEDRRYNIGEISEKTGLQKTANGWVKPKNGKQPRAKTGEGKAPSAGAAGLTTSQIKEFKEMAEEQLKKPYNENSGITKESYQKAQEHIKNQIAEYDKELAKRNVSKPAVGWEETQMASGKIYDTPDRTYRIIERNDWETGEKTFDIRDLKNMRADDIKGIKTLEEAKRIVAENKANNKKEAGRTGDSAPRVLTGDTRIRVRKA